MWTRTDKRDKQGGIVACVGLRVNMSQFRLKRMFAKALSAVWKYHRLINRRARGW